MAGTQGHSIEGEGPTSIELGLFLLHEQSESNATKAQNRATFDRASENV